MCAPFFAAFFGPAPFPPLAGGRFAPLGAIGSHKQAGRPWRELVLVVSIGYLKWFVLRRGKAWGKHIVTRGFKLVL